MFLRICMSDVNFSRKISEDVMNLDDAVLGVSIISDTGKVLSSFARDNLGKRFELDRYTYDANHGTWAKIILTLVEQASSSTFGPANAIITVHKGSILMLIPIRSRNIMIGLVLQRSVNQEYVISRILDLLDVENDKNEFELYGA
jgi:hypothetical protein